MKAGHTDLGSLLDQLDPHAPPAAVENDRARFSHAPLIIPVIARLTANHKVPEQEQLLTAGSVCFALLQSAQAFGFGAQWLSGWAAYDPVITARLGLGPQEKIAGLFLEFISVRSVSSLLTPEPRENTLTVTPFSSPKASAAAAIASAFSPLLLKMYRS